MTAEPSAHETLRIEWTSDTGDTARFLHAHHATHGPLALSDPLYRLGVFQDGQESFAVQPGDTLCWDGTRVWLHSSLREEIETCEAKEARMLKFGTGHIVDAQTTEGAKVQKTASKFSDQEWEAVLAEGESEAATDAEETREA